MTTKTARCSFEEMQKLYHAELNRLADETFESYYQFPTCEFYVVGTMQQGDIHRGYHSLRVAACEADHEELVISERLPRHLTRDGLRHWIKARLDNTPLWCFCY